MRFQAQLFALGGALKGKVFRIRESILLGRSGLCDIKLNDPKVSRKNTRIWVDASGCLKVTDLGSKNGTLVDQEPVTERVARSGNVISVGDAQFLVQLSSKAVDSTRPALLRLNLPGDLPEERTIDR